MISACVSDAICAVLSLRDRDSIDRQERCSHPGHPPIDPPEFSNADSFDLAIHLGGGLRAEPRGQVNPQIGEVGPNAYIRATPRALWLGAVDGDNPLWCDGQLPEPDADGVEHGVGDSRGHKARRVTFDTRIAGTLVGRDPEHVRIIG